MNDIPTEIDSIKNKQIPTGVKIISVLYYIPSILLLISAIFSIAGTAILREFFMGTFVLAGPGIGAFIIVYSLAIFAVVVTTTATISIVNIIVLLAFAVLSFFIGRGLWKAQGWAKIISIIFAILALLYGLFGIIGTPFTGQIFEITILVISVLSVYIGGYLLFSKKAKEHFT